MCCGCTMRIHQFRQICGGKQKNVAFHAERLIFAPRMPFADHLARHRQADLFLDTLPYNAHTTANDALWAGLPVLTCLGESFAGRVAASLLNAVGLPELITRSLEEYEALALRLAQDPVLLASLKAKLCATAIPIRYSIPNALRAISKPHTKLCGSDSAWRTSGPFRC